VCLLTFGLAGCSPSYESDPTDIGVTDAGTPLFITQNVAPVVVMEALFDGRIIVDDAGCIRQDSGDRPTVVWPKSYTLDRIDNELRVLNAVGREIGRIGGRFRLGGGEVPQLHEGSHLSSADRHRATTRCPGIFWITGDVPST
jgi:hypothetical protein